MIWFKPNITMALFLIISLNAKLINANIENYLDMDFGDLTNKNLKMRSASVPDQSDDQRSGNISEEQIQEMIADNESFDINRVPLSLSGRNVMDEVMKMPTKRSSGRICGTRLVDAIIKLCNGCVKPIGSKAINIKR
uniref:Secreted protein n=1 Tax=Onchocerca volvulus TaxID=6282 RepID=A0A8R1Y436_ONCVO